MHPLLTHITEQIAITETEFAQSLHYFEQAHFKRKALVIKANELVAKQFFVVKGCLRSYLLDDQEREHTVQFAIENWWVSDFTAYFTGAQSILQVECLEDCELLSIHKSALEQLYKEVPTLEKFFRRKLENAFVSFQKRIISNLYKSAEERYREFIANYPNIEQRVRNYQIASYLGITPESLSRIRKMSMSG
ncbi:MAG TPA: hypothetical protein DCS93_08255 [Microscillaceae bacterium]|nr:hypothetical protein [Microscillaceae bacterium]